MMRPILTFARVVTIAFVALMIAAIAIITRANESGLAAWWSRLNDVHGAMQTGRQPDPPPARRAATASTIARRAESAHGHLVDRTPMPRGYPSDDVLLAIKLDVIPNESMPMSYLVQSLYRGRVQWTGHADAEGWMLLPVPVSCGERQTVARVERVVVYAPNKAVGNRGRVLFDGVPPELVTCR